MDKNGLYGFMLSVITDMELQGRYSTAVVSAFIRPLRFRYMPIINQLFGKVNRFLPLRGLDAAEQLRGPLPIEKYRCTAYVQRYPIPKVSITVYFCGCDNFFSTQV